MFKAVRKAVVCLGLCGVAGSVCAEVNEPFLDLDLQKVLELEITSVSKKPLTISKSAAAVFVLTSEDIRRLGVRSLPDALRVVPGMHVAQLNANAWAVSARGLNGRFSNKLLVLIDGRAVYSPMFSGVFWDVQDTLLEDIDRIEVIRGPGAVLWGANAVNGVINIITKPAMATQGGVVDVGAGSDERGGVSARYGGVLQGGGHWRLFAKTFDREPLTLQAGKTRANDDWWQQRIGWRADLNPSHQDALHVQAEVYQGRHGESASLRNLTPPNFLATVPIEQSVAGGHVLARWQRELPQGNSFTAQAYLERTLRDWPGHVDYRLDTLDLDLQYRLRAIDGHDLIAGVAFRRNSDQVSPSTTQLPEGVSSVAAIGASQETQQLWSLLLQDDVTLVPERLTLTLGAKTEQYSEGSPKFMPNVRVLWTPSQDQTFWAAVSKAVRTPSRFDRIGKLGWMDAPLANADGVIIAPATLIEASGNMGVETLWAYEVGWKQRVSTGVSMDVAAYYNHYRDLRSGQLGPLVPTPYGYNRMEVPLRNQMSGRSAGLEAMVDWQLSRQIRVQLTANLQKTQLDQQNAGELPIDHEASSPRWAYAARLSYSPRPQHDIDMVLRQLGALKNVSFGWGVPGYTAVDARWAYRPNPTIEWSIVGRNLLYGKHLEYLSELRDAAPTLVGPSLWAGVKLTF